MTTAIEKMEEYLRKDGKMEITEEARATILEKNKARLRENYPLPHIPTGITELDNLIGGPGAYRGEPLIIPCPGLPKGRICQFLGDPKITRDLALRIAAQSQVGVDYLDQRGTLDLAKAREFGCEEGPQFEVQSTLPFEKLSAYLHTKSHTRGLTIIDASIVDEYFTRKFPSPSKPDFGDRLQFVKSNLLSTGNTMIFLQEESTRLIEFFAALRLGFERLENGRVRASAIKNMMSGTAGLDVEFDL